VTIPVNVIIRNIADRYVFTSDEVDVMVRDIHMARQAGADGVVIGALTPEKRVDVPVCRALVEAAQGLPVTFHRAFDQVVDQEQELEVLIKLGCARVLTSAGEPTVPQGLPGLARLIEQAGERIIVMPGGGVTAANAAMIVRTLHNKEMHGTFRAPGAPLAADTSFEELAAAITNIKV
jgi:copper homeostasis protein